VDAKHVRIVLNTLLILSFMIVAKEYVVYRKKSRSYESHVSQLELEIAGLRKESDMLKNRVLKLESDPATIEQMARDRLGMLRPGEEVVAPDTRPPASSRGTSR